MNSNKSRQKPYAFQTIKKNVCLLMERLKKGTTKNQTGYYGKIYAGW